MFDRCISQIYHPRLSRRKFVVSIKPEQSEGFIKTANFRQPRLRVVYSRITLFNHGSYVIYYNDDITPLLASHSVVLSPN